MFRLFAMICLLGASVLPAMAQEQYVPIKPGAGQEQVQAQCAICHSLDYIRTNGGFLSADGWKAEIAKMRGPFGAPLDDASADAILQYLTANYGAAPKG